MQLADKLLVFRLGQWKLALSLDKVVRALPILEVVPLPGSPSPIAGLIRLNDEVIPVADLRSLFGVPPRSIEGDDVLVVASSPSRQVALWADEVKGISELSPENRLSAEDLGAESRHVSGVVPVGDELLLLYDLDALLSEREEIALAKALEQFEEGESP